MKIMKFKYFSINLISLWLIALATIPLLLILITSFLAHDDSHLILWHFTLSNYVYFFHPIYFKILWLSLKLSVNCTILCLLIGYPAAFIIARSHGSLKNLFLLLMIIPFWTSSLIRTYAILTILKTKGLLNSALLALGIIHHPIQLIYTNTAVLVAVVYNLLPFMIFPLYSNIEKLDTRLLDAARDLGAGKIKIFKAIILPLTMPGIMAGTLLVFRPAMTLFYIPVLVGGAKSLLLGNLVESQFLEMHNWPGGAATSIVLTLFMLLLIFIYTRFARGKQRQELL